MNYQEFFGRAMGLENPFPYQERLSADPWPDLLNIPTGLGKTAAVIVAWLYKRRVLKDEATPRRLVYCLPMRVLVEQTQQSCEEWLKKLEIYGEPGDKDKVSVTVLMGGSDHLRKSVWEEHPDGDQIIIGTQDMLLSRALMRGYGMNRYKWPVHFALLHNDAFWVFDEVQLMGAGLSTSAQLEAFRRGFPLARASRTMWMSATLNPSWLATVDMKPHLGALKSLSINDDDRERAGKRLTAIKTVERAQLSLNKEAGAKKGQETYLAALCETVLRLHDAASQTVVIVNRVDRAQGLFRMLQARRSGKDLLVHSRFRANDRAEQARRLRESSTTDRIVVATQAIEAGVDISSKVLITELAPWPSLVQRFGRCNRYGEHNEAGGSNIVWVDIEDDADALPYESNDLSAAREKLATLNSASLVSLPPTDEQRPLTAILRRKDLLDLFNTDPDLSGFDVDVSDYIRDAGTPSLQVFWRDFDSTPNDPEPQPSPDRRELCPVSIGLARGLQKRRGGAWRWDGLEGKWARLDRDPRPGMTLLLNAADGGYDCAIGFDAELKKKAAPVIATTMLVEPEAFGSDPDTQIGLWVSLPQHLSDAAACARELCVQLNVDEVLAANITRAARWHDIGKVHEAFQCALRSVSAPPDAATAWAKSDRRGRLVYRMCRQDREPKRPYFRHELASMLAWLAQHGDEPNADLIAFLILAHHGKVRMSLRAMPTEKAPEAIRRFARGVWEGDVLPVVEFDGERSAAVELQLALMELGDGAQGPSWTSRALQLLSDHGPFRLAWLETLVRLADWRASAAEQIQQGVGGK